MSIKADVIDPTKNVLDLVHAAISAVQAEIASVRSELALRADHSREMREAESDRLNAIRQVDVLAAKVGTEQAQLAIQTLASAQAVTAKGLAEQLAAIVTRFEERIAPLERGSYENAGRQRMADPQLDSLLLEVKALRESSAVGAGRGAGQSSIWGYISLAVGVLLGLWALLEKVMR